MEHMKDFSLEAKIERLLPKLPIWPLTTFGTLLLIIFMAGVVFGVYQWLACLEIRGIL